MAFLGKEDEREERKKLGREVSKSSLFLDPSRTPKSSIKIYDCHK